MRQLESAWYDGARIDRSKVRIRRLGYFDDVNIETPPVPGTTDQADVEVTVTEKATGSLQAGVGYSSADGLVLSASVSQQNIFGTGNALTAAVNTSKINRTISLAFIEPYWTVDGISRTLEVLLPDDRPRRSRSRNTARRRWAARSRSAFRSARPTCINFGLRVEHTDLSLFDNSPPIYYDFVRQFGSTTNSFILSAGWSRDTRDDIIYPTKGTLQSALGEVGLLRRSFDTTSSTT